MRNSPATAQLLFLIEFLNWLIHLHVGPSTSLLVCDWIRLYGINCDCGWRWLLNDFLTNFLTLHLEWPTLYLTRHQHNSCLNCPPYFSEYRIGPSDMFHPCIISDFISIKFGLDSLYISHWLHKKHVYTCSERHVLYCFSPTRYD